MEATIKILILTPNYFKMNSKERLAAVKYYQNLIGEI